MICNCVIELILPNSTWEVQLELWPKVYHYISEKEEHTARTAWNSWPIDFPGFCSVICIVLLWPAIWCTISYVMTGGLYDSLLCLHEITASSYLSRFNLQWCKLALKSPCLADDLDNDTHDMLLVLPNFEIGSQSWCSWQDAVIIGSRLDSISTGQACRLALHGKILMGSETAEDFGGILKVFKVRRKEGQVEKISSDGRTAICKGLFKKESDPSAFMGMKVCTSILNLFFWHKRDRMLLDKDFLLGISFNPWPNLAMKRRLHNNLLGMISWAFLFQHSPQCNVNWLVFYVVMSD